MFYLDRLCVHRPQLCQVSLTGSSVRIPFLKAEVKHLELCRGVYLWQLERAVLFLHEYPLRAASWQLRVFSWRVATRVNLGAVPGTNCQMVTETTACAKENWLDHFARSIGTDLSGRNRSAQGITCMRKWWRTQAHQKVPSNLGGHVEYDCKPRADYWCPAERHRVKSRPARGRWHQECQCRRDQDAGTQFLRPEHRFVAGSERVPGRGAR